MRQLKEYDRKEQANLGRWHVFGDPKVAERLLEWSKKASAGEEVAQETSWGLRLIARAQGDNPRVLLELDTQKTREFLSQFKRALDVINVIEYGFLLLNDLKGPRPGSEQNFMVFIPQEGSNHIPLYNGGVEDTNVVLGAIDIGEAGFNYLDQDELMVELAQEPKVIVDEEALRAPVADGEVEDYEGPAYDEANVYNEDDALLALEAEA